MVEMLISEIVRIKLVVYLKICLILAPYLVAKLHAVDGSLVQNVWPRSIWSVSQTQAQRQEQEQQQQQQLHNDNRDELLPIERGHQILDHANELRQRNYNSNDRFRHLTDSLVFVQSTNVRGEGK